MSFLRSAAFIFLGALTLAACGGTSSSGTSSGGTGGAGGSGPSGTGGATTTTSTATASTTGTTATTSTTSTSSTTSTTSTGQGGAGGGAPDPVMSCSEIPAADCFSSFDCPDAADRCENRGTADLQVPCCVKGPRGTGKLGEACVGENDCVSALCLGAGSTYLCTDRCKSAAECPASLPKCITIAFSGSNDKFCTP
jgi:hypothetical protein